MIYVRAIEGTEFYLPMPAKRLGGDRYVLLECDDFDPADTHTLPEFVPGDTVETVARALHPDAEPLPVAERLISAVDPNRAYWELLFRIVREGPQVELEMTPARREAVERIRHELEDRERYHYPAIRRWINKYVGAGQGGNSGATDT